MAFAVTLQVSLAGVFRSARPQLALMAAPLDAGARSKLAAQLGAFDETRTEARDLALDAIRRDPLQPAALRALAQGLDQSDPRSRQAAAILMQQSHRISRRDQQTQLWFADYYGRLGNAEAMVRHLDIALRTSEASRAALFPMLVAAASDPRSEEIILSTLSRRPDWAIPFAAFAINSGNDLDLASRVARLLLDPRKPDDRTRYLTLLQRLVGAERYASAWEIYRDPALGLRNNNGTTIRHGDFEAAEDNSPFDWSYTQEPELWASRERLREAGGLVLRVAAYNGRSGEVARQFLHLPPGSFRLRLRVGDIPANQFERPEIRIECVAPKGEAALLSLRPDTAGADARELAARFIVPSDCAFQRISIGIAGEDALLEPTPWLDDIRIE